MGEESYNNWNYMLFPKNKKKNSNVDNITFFPSCLISHLNLKDHFPRVVKGYIIFPKCLFQTLIFKLLVRKYQNTLLKKILHLHVSLLQLLSRLTLPEPHLTIALHNA